MEARIDQQARRGAISRREASPNSRRTKLAPLVRYGRNALSGQESAQLRVRSIGSRRTRSEVAIATVDELGKSKRPPIDAPPARIL